jgi:hypothetical protein
MMTSRFAQYTNRPLSQYSPCGNDEYETRLGGRTPIRQEQEGFLLGSDQENMTSTHHLIIQKDITLVGFHQIPFRTLPCSTASVLSPCQYILRIEDSQSQFQECCSHSVTRIFVLSPLKLQILTMRETNAPFRYIRGVRKDGTTTYM